MNKIVRFIGFIFVLFFVYLGVYEALSWKDTTGEYLSTTTRFYETEKNIIDVLFVGSSHCFCSVLPSLLWEDYGMSAFNMSISCQDREATYYYIKETLKTQKPKIVCVELGTMMYDGIYPEANLYRNLLSMKLSKNSYDLINASVGKEDRMLFLTRWSIIHTRYAELKKYDFVTNDFSVYGRGEALYLENVVQNKSNELLSYEEIGDLSENKKEWLDQMIEMSEKNNFELVFFSAPFQTGLEEKGMYNAINEYLATKDIPYINFNQEGVLPELNYATDFLDSQHTNTYGATKITNHLGEFLTTTFDIPNHKGDEKYQMWELDKIYCEHFLQEPEIKEEYDWNTYADYILNSKDLVTVISLDGDYKSSTWDLYGMLFSLEIESGYDSGGKWIIENREVINHISGDDMEPIIMDLGEDVLKVQNVIVQNNASEMFANIMIDNEELGEIYQGLTILIYDKILHKVIDVKCWY